MRFISPIWLAAFAALLVPLVLHLWNRRPTQVVRVGSLRGLSGPPGPRSFGHRLNEIPLLLVRLAVLAAVILALAGLAVARRGVAAEPRHLLLIDPALLADSLAVYADPLVDSLRRTGAPIHLLARGFPELGDASAVTTHRPGVWALLRQLDDTLATGTRVSVLALPTAGGVGPMRPSLRSAFQFRRSDGVFLLESGAFFRSDPDLLSVRPVDSASVEIVVGQGFEDEAELVAAAWSAAIEATSGRTPQVLIREIEDGPSATNPSVIIWLADQSVYENALNIVRAGGILVQMIATDLDETASPRIHLAWSSVAPADQFQESVFHRGTEPGGHPVLTDGAGRPLLTVTSHGLGRHYRLATRLTGEWSTIGLGADLPEIALLTLRQHQTGVAAASIHLSQALPRQRAPDPLSATDWNALSGWLVLLAALLLTGERLVAHRRTRAAA